MSRFIWSAGVLFGVTGIAKIWAALGSASLLEVSDPVTGFKFKNLLLGVGLLEVLLAAACFIAKQPTSKLMAVAWMTTNFALYRAGLWLQDWHRPCNCLGNLTDALHISPQLADNIMKGVLAYLLIGSYGLLFWEWRNARRRKAEGGGQITANQEIPQCRLLMADESIEFKEAVERRTRETS